jgi:hypothetical protein
MRLIDADALRADAITRSGGTEFAFDNCYPFWQFSQAIAQAPTIEAAPVVHGRWEQVQRWATKAKYRCSICGREIMSAVTVNIEKYPFCHCGADMRGEEDGK